MHNSAGNPPTLHRVARSELFYLLLAGGIIRGALAANRPFFGDEPSTLRLLCLPFSYILTHFDLWLTMNFFIALEKIIARFFGDGLLAMRLVPLLADTGSIAAIYVLSGRLFPKIPRFVAAALFAANPYMIESSATARVYSLFIFLVLLMLLSFVNWHERPTGRTRWTFGMVCCVMVLAHLGGVMLVAWAGLMVLADIAACIYKKAFIKERLHEALRLLVVLTVCMSPAMVYYGKMWPQIREHNMFEYTGADFGIIRQVPAAFELFMGTASPWMACAYAGLLAAGFLYCAVHDRKRCAWFAAWIMIPLVVTKAMGYSYVYKDLARFNLFALPVILVLIAAGLWWFCSLAPAAARRLLVPACATGIVCAALPGVQTKFEQATWLPFHRVADYLKHNMRAGDKVMCAEFFDFMNLSCYFPCAERSFASAPATVDRIIETNLESHLSGATVQGRLFLVAVSKSIPDFGGVPVKFGYIKVVSLPEESREARVRRLIEGLSRNAPRIFTDEVDCAQSTVYALLQQAYAAQGNQDAAAYYRQVRQRCFEKMERRYLERHGAQIPTEP